MICTKQDKNAGVGMFSFNFLGECSSLIFGFLLLVYFFYLLYLSFISSLTLAPLIVLGKDIKSAGEAMSKAWFIRLLF